MTIAEYLNIKTLYGPRQVKKSFRACAKAQMKIHPLQMQNLIMAIALH